MRSLLAVLLLLVAPTAVAKEGGAFGVKTMRAPLPTREVERSLLMPKGWLELQLGYDYKLATGAWGSDGSIEPFEDAKWTYATPSATIRYGIGPRWELWWHLPFHHAHLTNDKLGTDIADFGLGDPRFGSRFLLYGEDKPGTSVALELAYKGPAGDESPGTYIGGPNNVQSFPFTTGTPDLSVGVGAKHNVGPVAFTGRVAYVRRFSSIVQYLVEMEELQFLGRIKPGDQVLGDAEVMFQAGPVAVSAAGDLEWRDVTKVGTTSKGWSPSQNLDAVEGSDGLSLDIVGGLTFNISRGVDISAHVVQPVMGEDLLFFPIEDLSPTYGRTYGGAVEVRY